MSGWSSTRATRKRRTRSWPKERVTTTRSPATPPLLVAFHPPWAVIYLTDKVAREVAECSPTPLSKPDLCYSHHAARWLPRAASTMSRQSTVPRSVNKTSFIRRYLCWRGERPQARRTGPVVSTTASRSVTNVSNESLRPRGQRFARDSPLEGDGFELPVPRSETTISASQRGNGRWRTQEASRAAAPTDPPLRLSRQPKSGAPPPESAAESRPFFTQRGAPGGRMRHRPAHLDAGLSTRRPSR